jgi:hypothetical protein
VAELGFEKFNPTGWQFFFIRGTHPYLIAYSSVCASGQVQWGYISFHTILKYTSHSLRSSWTMPARQWCGDHASMGRQYSSARHCASNAC